MCFSCDAQICYSVHSSVTMPSMIATSIMHCAIMHRGAQNLISAALSADS